MAEEVNIRSSNGEVQFSLTWDTVAGRTAAEVTRGRLLVSVAGTPIWSAPERDDEGFEWTWVELLEHLAANWAYLCFEEDDPFGFVRGDPKRLAKVREIAEQAWDEAELRDDVRNQREEALWAFEQSHDLAAALQGAWVPSLRLLRVGACMHVVSNGQRCIVDAADAILSLDRLATAISTRLAGCNDPRAVDAVHAWESRDDIEQQDFVSISTGLSREVLSEIEDENSVAETWGLPAQGPLRSTELLAVARMARSDLDPHQIRDLIDLLRKSPLVKTARLDALAKQAQQWNDAQPKAPNWDEGRRVARWFRQEIGVRATARVEPALILKNFGIPTQVRALPSAALDAVCCWGPAHGPAVLVNSTGKRSQSGPGRRATFAHEIAHLLLDRNGALPLAELLGRQAPAPAEQRANAFAAELLMPMEIAGPRLAASSKPPVEVQKLAKEFGASPEIIAWQARNSGVDLPVAVRRHLRTLVATPAEFD